MINLFEAIKVGKSLASPEFGKMLNERITIGGAVLAAIIAAIRAIFPDIQIPQPILDYGPEAIGTFLALLNLYFNRATTKKGF